MVNLPHSEHGATLARGLPVGLHLNLSRGGPLSPRFPASWLREGAFDEKLAASIPADVVAAEAEAQLARAEELLLAPPQHADAHRHLHRLPEMLPGLCRVCDR